MTKNSCAYICNGFDKYVVNLYWSRNTAKVGVKHQSINITNPTILTSTPEKIHTPKYRKDRSRPLKSRSKLGTDTKQWRI